jgi:threonine/homoserine/homoserine lactone efflux protein
MYGSALMTGMGLGLTVAAPIGPMAALCIQRTFDTGRRAGVATGLGASTVHTMFGATALAEISTPAQSLERNIRLFYIGSAILLV